MLSRSLNKVVTSIKSSSIIRMSSATAAATSAPTANAANALKASKAPKKGKLQVSLKTPKGTKDWADSDMVIREAILALYLAYSRSMVVSLSTHLFSS